MKDFSNIDSIIYPAANLFALRGYEAVSINEICKAGNISKGRFYYYFNDKEDLFTACCKYCYRLINHVFDDFVIDENLTLYENLLNLYNCYTKIFQEHDFVPHIVLEVNSSNAPFSRTQRHDLVKDHMNKFVNMLTDMLHKFNIDINPMFVAIGFHSAFIIAYTKDGVLSHKRIMEFTGEDYKDPFAYYLDKILFGIFPRDEKTLSNPKANSIHDLSNLL